MKNIKSTNNTSNAITSNKAFTAWGVEVDGEISPYDIFRTRDVARDVRNDTSRVYGTDAKCSVRKLLIVPVGR